jgi:hypothetical protein
MYPKYIPNIIFKNAGLDAAGDDILDGGGAISAPTANMLLGDDALVPTRQLVKKQSSRTTIEARRKAEAAIRAKRCVYTVSILFSIRKRKKSCKL